DLCPASAQDARVLFVEEAARRPADAPVEGLDLAGQALGLLGRVVGRGLRPERQPALLQEGRGELLPDLPQYGRQQGAVLHRVVIALPLAEGLVASADVAGGRLPLGALALDGEVLALHGRLAMGAAEQGGEDVITAAPLGSRAPAPLGAAAL